MTFRCRFPVAILGAYLATQPLQAIGADQERTPDASNALGREMSTCSAFFALASSVLKSALPDDATVGTRYDTAGKVMLAQAIAVTEAVGIGPDTAVDWSRAAMQDMVKEINADPKNSAALMTSKYDKPCQLLLKDSAKRLRELIDSGTPD